MSLIAKEKKTPKQQSFHWYDGMGKPRHTVPYADGKPGKKTTATDARKLTLYPSVTTIAGVIAKHNLSIWSENLFIETCGKNPMGELELYDEYIERIRPMVESIKEEAPRLGDEIHAMLESWGKREIGLIKDEFETILNCVKDWYHLMSINYPVHCERRIVPELAGFGGTVDVISDEVPRGRPVILDYKSTKFLDKKGKRKKPRPYESHLMQLAAYKYGLEMEDKKYGNARCMLLYIATDAEDVEHYELSELELEEYLEQFLLLARYFARSKKLTHVTERIG